MTVIKQVQGGAGTAGVAAIIGLAAPCGRHRATSAVIHGASNAIYDVDEAHLATDRFYDSWLLTLCGLQRSQVMGRTAWSDLDLTNATMTIARTRARGRTAHARGQAEDPVGRRVLSLPPPDIVTAALAEMRAAQMADFGVTDGDDGYRTVDDAGQPIRYAPTAGSRGGCTRVTPPEMPP